MKAKPEISRPGKEYLNTNSASTKAQSPKTLNTELHGSFAQRVLGTVMGVTFPNHNQNSYNRNPTFYYIGTSGPLKEH